MVGMESMNTNEVTVIGSNASRTENSSQVAGSVPVVTPHVGASQPVSSSLATGQKKRGRPRKYGPDGSVTMIARKAMSPKPIPFLAPASPPVFNFSSEKHEKTRSPGSVSVPQPPKTELENLVDRVSLGSNFGLHVINVHAGEDVMMKVISFSQEVPWPVSILSASGSLSSVTLLRPDCCGGSLTYEGQFDFLSLNGSFIPSEIGEGRNRCGGLCVSLASLEGQIVAGRVGGLLRAASSVKVMVASFLTENQPEQRAKKPKTGFFSHTVTTPATPASSHIDLFS